MAYSGAFKKHAPHNWPELAHLIENSWNLKGAKFVSPYVQRSKKNQKSSILLLLTCAFGLILVNLGRKKRRNFGFLFLKR